MSAPKNTGVKFSAGCVVEVYKNFHKLYHKSEPIGDKLGNFVLMKRAKGKVGYLGNVAWIAYPEGGDESHKREIWCRGDYLVSRPIDKLANKKTKYHKGYQAIDPLPNNILESFPNIPPDLGGVLVSTHSGTLREGQARTLLATFDDLFYRVNALEEIVFKKSS